MLGQRRQEYGWVVVLATSLAGPACGASRPAAEAPSSGEEKTKGSSEATTDESAAGETTDKTSPDSSSSSAASDAAEKKPLSALCDAMCGAQSSKCKPAQVTECRRNYCERYGKPPDACEPSVRSALECGEADPDFLICSHVVPEACAKNFKAAESCLATGVAPEPEQEGPKMPEGWAKYEGRDADFSITMPKGVQVKVENGTKTWSSEAGGVTYEVRREPMPAEKKFNMAAFHRIAQKLLGPCASKMKLFSIVERPDRTMIQFRTTCPDKSEQRGMLYVQGQDFFVIRATGAGIAKSPDGDTFAYSFERP